MYLQVVHLISVIGVEGVGFIVCKDVNRAGRNPVLLHHKALIRDRVFNQTFKFNEELVS